MVAAEENRGDLSGLNIYHRRQVESLSEHQFHQELSKVRMASITGAEMPARIIMNPPKRMASRAAYASGERTPTAISASELPHWEALAKDTEQNETIRRLAIHDYLKDRNPLRPDEIKKWVYREVLHADLDDPYLGLGKLLFDTYPFAEEDVASN